MDLNLQTIILNSTLIQPPQESSNITLLAAVVGATAALIGALVSNLTYYYIEKRNSENDLRLRLRDERKKLYIEFLRELNKIQFSFIYAKNQESPWFEYLDHEISSLKTKFKEEIEIIGNEDILNILIKIHSNISSLKLLNQMLYEDEADKIRGDTIDKISEIKRIIRSELVPLPEKEDRKPDWWRFWK